MQRTCSGFSQDLCCVAPGDSGGSDHLDTVADLVHEARDRDPPFERGARPARRENTLDSEPEERFTSGLKVRRCVKGPMEGHPQPFRGAQHVAHEREVDRSLASQCADRYALRPRTAGKLDVAEERTPFSPCRDHKTAGTGPHQHHCASLTPLASVTFLTRLAALIDESERLRDEPGARRHPSDIERCAKLDAVRTDRERHLDGVEVRAHELGGGGARSVPQETCGYVRPRVPV